MAVVKTSNAYVLTKRCCRPRCAARAVPPAGLVGQKMATGSSERRDLLLFGEEASPLDEGSPDDIWLGLGRGRGSSRGAGGGGGAAGGGGEAGAAGGGPAEKVQ